jgi:multidrug efflux system outer membrane protein
MMTKLAFIVAALALLALGACATSGDSLPSLPLSASAMPSAWVEPSAVNAVALTHDWWRDFGSAELSELIAATLAASPDMGIALEHVRQAEAQVQIAGATLFPALNFSAATTHRETRPTGGRWSGEHSSLAALTASYEIDLWGGIAAEVRSAESSLRATRFDRETVRLTLVAGVASGYFQVLSLRGRLAIERKNLAIAEQVFNVVGARARYGAASALDLARQQAEVLTLRASIPPLELQERQTLYALAILTGRPPEGFDVPGSTVTALAVPQVDSGLPANLLVRRPDLASAEARLASANANIAAARAALLPSIVLTGSAGLASQALINVLNAPTAALALGAAVLQPIFDGGSRRGQVDLAVSVEREGVEDYRQAILAALAEVEGALAAGSRTADQETLQAQVVEQARIALRLAEIRYREGIDDLLAMLDAQRTLFQAEDQLAQVRLARLQASISLFKALGGGWSSSCRFSCDPRHRSGERMMRSSAG